MSGFRVVGRLDAEEDGWAQVVRCDECGALVDDNRTSSHSNFHDRLTRAFAALGAVREGPRS